MMREQEGLAQLSSHWVTVEGRRIHYRAGGRGELAIVLVHGLSVSGKYLLPTAARLINSFRVYVPDLPGFGASEKPRQVLDIPGMAETLKAWMDVVGLEQAFLLGNSLGCLTITMMAASHSERVTGIILVSPVGDPGVRNTLRLVLRGLNDFVREPPSLWPVMFQDFLRAGLRRTALTLRSMQHCRLNLWLPLVEVPSLIVRGGRDRIVPMWWFDRVAELLPQSRVAVMRDAAHVPNFSHPARLTALVRAFMESGREGRKS